MYSMRYGDVAGSTLFRFAGSIGGAEGAAVVYSAVESAKA